MLMTPARAMIPLFLVLAAVLSACSLACDPIKDFEKNDLEQAASYPGSRGGPRRLPLDTWTRNPRLEAFLAGALKTESVGVVAAKYGMQCLPSAQDVGCTDCFTCRKTFREWAMGMVTPPLPIYMEIFKCVDWGEVLVQTEVGPGSLVTAMTYWKTTPESRSYMTR
jgi:hypothetical protein